MTPAGEQSSKRESACVTAGEGAGGRARSFISHSRCDGGVLKCPKSTEGLLLYERWKLQGKLPGQKKKSGFNSPGNTSVDEKTNLKGGGILNVFAG